MKLTNEADEESFFAELELAGPHSKDDKIAPPLCDVIECDGSCAKWA